MLLAVLGWLLPLAADAANVSEAHPHKGQIPRLKMDGKPNVKLSAKDLEKIESGQLWMQSKEENSIGRGIGISDIAAPPDVVFKEIAGLQAYVGKVPMLKELKVYSKDKKGKEIIEKATYVVKVIPGYNFEYYVEHHALPEQGVLLFYLDYDRYSDFNDLQGKWVVEAHPTKEGWSRVYYQCDLMLWGYAPKIVKSLLTNKGLASAMAWVKRESEKRAPKRVEAFVGGPAVWGAGAASLSRGLADVQVPLPSAEEAQPPSAPLGCAALAALATALALRQRSRRARVH